MLTGGTVKLFLEDFCDIAGAWYYFGQSARESSAYLIQYCSSLLA
jgi:hypothetical protein